MSIDPKIQRVNKRQALADALKQKKLKKIPPPEEVRLAAPTPSVTTANYSYEDMRKFHCTGRIKDRKNTAIATTMWIKDDLKTEIEKYCSGQQTIYMNRLLELGLDVVKSWESTVDYDENVERERKEKEKAKKELIQEMRENGELPSD